MGKHIEQTSLTRQSIIDSFWKIAEREGMKKISVSSIAKTAGINRSTFYEYFTDIEDLTDTIEGVIIDELKQLIGALYVKYNLNCSHRDLARALIPYYDRLALILGEDGDKRFLSKIQIEAVKLFSAVAQNEDPMIEYEIVYVVSAFAGVLAYWYETGKRISEDDFTELFHTLSIRGLSAQCTNAE